MKKKILKATFVVIVGLIGGINVYNAQKTEVLSDVAMANVEALAQTENPNSTIIGECWRSYVVIEECYVECSKCGKKWYPEESELNSVARNVSGQCSCGNSSWKNYN